MYQYNMHPYNMHQYFQHHYSSMKLIYGSLGELLIREREELGRGSSQAEVHDLSRL